MPGILESTPIRDFSGGWNVADSDMNLSSKFQPISENIQRGIDGSLTVRWGTRLETDFLDGIETTYTIATGEAVTSLDFVTVDTQPTVEITWPSHNFSSGDHVTISGLSADINGIPYDDINGIHGVIKTSESTIKIAVRSAATSGGTVNVTDLTIVQDTHTLNGNIIEGVYFNNRSVLFTDIGEVGTYDEDGNRTRIWGYSHAEDLQSGLTPTRRCNHWSRDTFKSTIIACNGYDKDKPIQIKDDFTVEFLVDKASGSNAAVPKADYVLCMSGFVIFIRTEYGNPFLEFSAKGTDGTFTRDPEPADSAEVDLSTVTSTTKPTILGASRIRDKAYAAFFDRGVIGTIGEYNDNIHVPDFKDTIAEHGTIGHRTIVTLGNDILMCDYDGVPSVSISNQSGIFVPTRLSELIAPEISSHLSRLSEQQLSEKAFAFFNGSDKSYMLFLPKYNEVTQQLSDNPILMNQELNTLNYAIIYAPNHRLIARSSVTIAGSTDIGDLPAASINGVREIKTIIDENTFVVELGGAPTTDPPYVPPEGGVAVNGGGGDSVTITPVNDETVVYAFEYNKEFRIRRWTRFRGWNFDCGYVSQQAQTFLAKGTKLYVMGSSRNPLYADFINEHDKVWQTNTPYTEGDRVLDEDLNEVFICATTFTGTSDSSFAIQRANNSNFWEPYEGTPIDWEVETPWSDMRARDRIKINKLINVDSEGTDQFTVSAFVNKIRYDPNTFVLTPVRSLIMQAGDSGGFGMPNPGNWGGGRRTREEKVWPFGIRGKYIRWRFSGQTTKKVKITNLTMYYRLGNIR